MESEIFTKDIACHFNKELEKNLKNALFNFGFEFENPADFYNFVQNKVIRTEENETFKLYLKETGSYLLKYNYELGKHYGHFDVIDHYTFTATLGSIEIINRDRKPKTEWV